MTNDTFVKGLSLLKEAFPGKAINARIYFEALKDIPDESFLSAVSVIVNTTTKLYPDDNLIAIIREKISGTVEDKAVLAWTKARAAIMSVGTYKSVSFEDPVINGVIEAMGGWEKFCAMLVEEEAFRQKDFVKLYEALSRSGRTMPVRLLGCSERLNGRPEKTEMIGDYREPRMLA